MVNEHMARWYRMMGNLFALAGVLLLLFGRPDAACVALGVALAYRAGALSMSLRRWLWWRRLSPGERRLAHVLEGYEARMDARAADDLASFNPFHAVTPEMPEDLRRNMEALNEGIAEGLTRVTATEDGEHPYTVAPVARWRTDTCPVHLTPLPCRDVCLAHQEHEPCPTCAAYIAAGL